MNGSQATNASQPAHEGIFHSRTFSMNMHDVKPLAHEIEDTCEKGKRLGKGDMEDLVARSLQMAGILTHRASGREDRRAAIRNEKRGTRGEHHLRATEPKLIHDMQNLHNDPLSWNPPDTPLAPDAALLDIICEACIAEKDCFSNISISMSIENVGIVKPS